MEIFASVVGGNINKACQFFSFVGGGEDNLTCYHDNSYFSAIVAGCQNIVEGDHAFIGGGSRNYSSGSS